MHLASPLCRIVSRTSDDVEARMPFSTLSFERRQIFCGHARVISREGGIGIGARVSAVEVALPVVYPLGLYTDASYSPTENAVMREPILSKVL